MQLFRRCLLLGLVVGAILAHRASHADGPTLSELKSRADDAQKRYKFDEKLPVPDVDPKASESLLKARERLVNALTRVNSSHTPPPPGTSKKEVQAWAQGLETDRKALADAKEAYEEARKADANREETRGQLANLTGISYTRDQLGSPTSEEASAAPWYSGVMDLLKRWKDGLLSEQEKESAAYEITDALSMSKPEEPPAGETTTDNPGVDGHPTIVIRGGGMTNRSWLADARVRLAEVLARSSGYRPTPELTKGLQEQVIPQLERSAAQPAATTASVDQESAFRRLGVLTRIYAGNKPAKGVTSPTPLQGLIHHARQMLSTGKISAPFVRANAIVKGELDWTTLRLCENKVFVNPSGVDLGKRVCGKYRGRYNRESMVNLSKAYNRLSKEADKRLFWTTFYSCVAVGESADGWGPGHRRSANPNDASTWTSPQGDMGTFQFNPRQAFQGGNLKPCLEEWKEKHKGSKLNLDNPAQIQALVTDPNQEFNQMCAMQKIFSNMQAQLRWVPPLKERKDQKEESCASPFNQYYNHFNALMCNSRDFMACMGKFVNLTQPTGNINLPLLRAINDYYNSHSVLDELSKSGHP